MGNAGAADAINNVAVNLRSGKGFKKNENLALLWYETAAEKGSIVALNNLASIYAYRSMKVVQRDFDKALSYYEQAAALGDKEAAMHINNLAVDLLKGDNGVKKDEAEAVKWFEKAAELGNDLSMRTLGILYSNSAYEGIVEQDLTTAVEWFEKAANAGNVDSMERLATIYAASGSNDADYQKAFDWYTKAVDSCDPKDTQSIKRIAMYINNIGVLCTVENRASYDPDLAFQAFNKAAMLGDQSGMFNLGKAYIIGYGTKEDAERGNQLLGAFRGDKEAFVKGNGWFTSDVA